MAIRKSQGKAGVAAHRRGQQMGDARSTNAPAKQEQAKDQTPALRGRRKAANKFYADDSAQAAGSNAARPRSNSPSVPAAVPTATKLGEPGGEKVFKQRQAKKRKTD
jgi:hypothetical protein